MTLETKLLAQRLRLRLGIRKDLQSAADWIDRYAALEFAARECEEAQEAYVRSAERDYMVHGAAPLVKAKERMVAAKAALRAALAELEG